MLDLASEKNHNELPVNHYQTVPYQKEIALESANLIQPTTKLHRILIVDDNQANCELLEAYLTQIECETEIAVNGLEALEKLDSFAPDLILLDVMMPKLSGFEVCEKIKSNPDLKRIMILMVTALNELGDIERAVNAGTDDFLSKPINRIELLKRVENLLALKDVHDENERLRRYIQNMETDS